MTAEKNARIAATRRTTIERHSAMRAVTRELKLTASKMSKEQRGALLLAFKEAKWVHNHLITRVEGWKSWPAAAKTVPVRLPDGTFEERELHLGSQVKQSLQQRVGDALKGLAVRKANGGRVGALKPKREINSIPLKQPGTTFRIAASGRSVKIQGLPGRFTLRGDSLEGLEIANATLASRASGYYLLVTGYRNRETIKPNGKTIGLDFGVKTHITTSEGVEYSVLFGETERLKRLQRKLQRQVKGSANRMKTLVLLRREYEKLDRRKSDSANKIVHELLLNESVVIQDDNLRGWKTRYGKRLHHSILGRVKAKLVASPRVLVLDRFAPSTQLCSSCGSLNPHGLGERVYQCACGYSEQRDVHAARNMILLARETGWEKPPAGRRVAPVDWETTVARNASHKPNQDEAGNETAYEQSGSTAGEASVETRLSSAVA